MYTLYNIITFCIVVDILYNGSTVDTVKTLKMGQRCIYSIYIVFDCGEFEWSNGGVETVGIDKKFRGAYGTRSLPFYLNNIK